MSGPKRNKNEIERAKAIHITGHLKLNREQSVLFCTYATRGQTNLTLLKIEMSHTTVAQTAKFTLHIFPQKPAPDFFIFSCIYVCVYDRERENNILSTWENQQMSSMVSKLSLLICVRHKLWRLFSGVQCEGKRNLLTQPLHFESATALTC